MAPGKPIKCLHCGDVIQSTFRHDFQTCSCGSISVDGGGDYGRYLFRKDAQYSEDPEAPLVGPYEISFITITLINADGMAIGQIIADDELAELRRMEEDRETGKTIEDTWYELKDVSVEYIKKYHNGFHPIYGWLEAFEQGDNCPLWFYESPDNEITIDVTVKLKHMERT